MDSELALLHSKSLELKVKSTYDSPVSALSSQFGIHKDEFGNKLQLALSDVTEDDKIEAFSDDLEDNLFRGDLLRFLCTTFSWDKVQFEKVSNMDDNELESYVTVLEEGEERMHYRLLFVLQWNHAYKSSLFSTVFLQAFSQRHAIFWRLQDNRVAIIRTIPLLLDDERDNTNDIILLFRHKAWYLLKSTPADISTARGPQGGSPGEETKTTSIYHGDVPTITFTSAMNAIQDPGTESLAKVIPPLVEGVAQTVAVPTQKERHIERQKSIQAQKAERKLANDFKIAARIANAQLNQPPQLSTQDQRSLEKAAAIKKKLARALVVAVNTEKNNAIRDTSTPG